MVFFHSFFPSEAIGLWFFDALRGDRLERTVPSFSVSAFILRRRSAKEAEDPPNRAKKAIFLRNCGRRHTDASRPS